MRTAAAPVALEGGTRRRRKCAGRRGRTLTRWEVGSSPEAWAPGTPTRAVAQRSRAWKRMHHGSSPTWRPPNRAGRRSDSRRIRSSQDRNGAHHGRCRPDRRCSNDAQAQSKPHRLRHGRAPVPAACRERCRRPRRWMHAPASAGVRTRAQSPSRSRSGSSSTGYAAGVEEMTCEADDTPNPSTQGQPAAAGSFSAFMPTSAPAQANTQEEQMAELYLQDRRAMARLPRFPAVGP